METYLRDLLVALQKQGARCSAIVHQSKVGFASSYELFGHGTEALYIVRVATWFKLVFTPINPCFLFHANQLLAQNSPRILHLHFPNPTAMCLLVSPLARRLTWIIQWQSDVVTPKSSLLLRICYLLYRPLERAVLKRADHIIVSSPTYLEHSKPLKPYKDKCHVIPLGVRDNFVGKTQRSLGVQARLHVVALGRLTHYKGFDILIRALEKKPNIELTLIGAGKQLRSLQKLSDNLSVSQRVTFLTALTDEERDKILQRADCLCLPSNDKTESFGIVLLEAMSAGLPCIVSNVVGSGMSWVVDDERTGLVFQNQSYTSLAEALDRLDKDRELLRELGFNARKRYESQFTIKQSAAAVMELYGTQISQ